MIDLCNEFAEQMALGMIVPDGQPIRVPGIPPNTTCHHAGDLDDPDYNNVSRDSRMSLRTRLLWAQILSELQHYTGAHVENRDHHRALYRSGFYSDRLRLRFS